MCPECGGSKLIRDYDTAEVVCMQCGYVVAEKIADSRPEWRAFDDEQRAKRARTGAPMTFTIHDKGLSTIIDWRDRPSGTKSVTADQRIELYKLRKWQRRVRVSDATERNLAVALSELSKNECLPYRSCRWCLIESFLRVDVQQRTKQPAVCQVEFRTLHYGLRAIGEPRIEQHHLPGSLQRG